MKTNQIADFFIKRKAESYKIFEEKNKETDWLAPFNEWWTEEFRSLHARFYMPVQKLQLLLGYAYVWFLALKGEKLFDEKMYVCDHGYFFHSQNKRFNGKNKRFKGKLANVNLDSITTVLPPNISEFLWHIWECYGDGFNLGGFKLLDMQCGEAPYKKAQESEGKEVKDEWIKEFYSPDENKTIYDFLPRSITLIKSSDGLYQIARLAKGAIPAGR